MLKRVHPLVNPLIEPGFSNVENQVLFQVIPTHWHEKSLEFSCRELAENVLRLMTYIVEGIECQLVFNPPDSSEFLFPLMQPIFTWAETIDSSTTSGQNIETIHVYHIDLHQQDFESFGRLTFKTHKPTLFEQQKYVIEIADVFFEQLYNILFFQANISLLKLAYLEMLFQIAENIDNHKINMKNHSSHTASLTKIIAAQVGCTHDQEQLFFLTGIFHDIGKIIIPQSTLHKTSKLDLDEWHLVQTHAAFGASLFAPLEDLHTMIPIIRGHHEWYNGKGYPDQLHGVEIPLGARILAVADAYGTMIDGRIYRKKRTPLEAQNELLRYRKTQFDPFIVDAFLASLNSTSGK
jgi:HD-GYP domain-containing protein (c-di-GMP phosphodiesterase class II)